ncbi:MULTISPECIES: ribonuclease domain-containing protein [unclassified Campylobacter]|uniref:ribonuclease domain-containing protein n=1 Tax=unclassified Campylobacter TaxID=2593542 RepID=UPI0022E9DAF4|nr:MULTISPECIES: ribonuclease domain-containing protein [unclassified Campylobacter]MDA3042865.1 ribonuclease [Campylobacter sp. JMF_09 ED2]MDA3044300.1 ribonuclease [Campylobacter sp. JMF_07 ED4]MDA3063649.1 ribonuclease [Campylobacter sp. JMF_11 EL3]MDA3071275.1 ribonuclease [Campylobacter sp. VBCF_03 NA9]MDA3074735.1 ribonuclease [Campylobacter sp. JMF_05 ED3]
MSKKFLNFALIFGVLALALFLFYGKNSISQSAQDNGAQTPVSELCISKECVSEHIKAHGKLPSNFITKKQANTLGWSGGDLHAYAKDKSIGGDRFGNYERALPAKKGRIYTEADIDYKGGARGKKRLVFSNDGLIFYTKDHYKSFERVQ